MNEQDRRRKRPKLVATVNEKTANKIAEAMRLLPEAYPTVGSVLDAWAENSEYN